MKHILKLISVFVLLVFSGFAGAYQICSAYGNTKNFNISVTDAPPVICAPRSFFGGTGSFPTIRRSAGGWVAWNYCTDGFSYKLQFGYITDAVAKNTDFVKELVATQTATDTTKALKDFSNKWTTSALEDADALPIWCPHYDEMKAGKPAPIAYKVAPWSGATYRNTYAISSPFNGARTTTSNGKVSILTAGLPTLCNCMKGRVVEGTGTAKATYCSVNNIATTVAACTAK